MTTEPEPRSIADRCRSTCRWNHCTGKGEHLHYSHRCPFAPPPPPPPCNVCGEQSVDRFLVGHRCSGCAPTYPTPRPSTVPSPSEHRAPYEYGTASSDPDPIRGATLS